MIRFLFHPIRFFRLLCCVFRYVASERARAQHDELQARQWYSDNQ